MSISNTLELVILAAVCNNTSPTLLPVATVYAQLHTDNPGEDCTANVATNTTRQAVAFSAAAAGQAVSSGTVSWASVPADETYRATSLWTAATAGTALWYGPLAAPKQVWAGDTAVFGTGLFVVSLD